MKSWQRLLRSLNPTHNFLPLEGNEATRRAIWRRNQHYRHELLGGAIAWSALAVTTGYLEMISFQEQQWGWAVALFIPLIFLLPGCAALLGAWIVLCLADEP